MVLGTRHDDVYLSRYFVYLSRYFVYLSRYFVYMSCVYLLVHLLVHVPLLVIITICLRHYLVCNVIYFAFFDHLPISTI